MTDRFDEETLLSAVADECDECNDTGWVSDAPTQRQRSLAKQFGWEVPDFFDRPCPSCCKARRG